MGRHKQSPEYNSEQIVQVLVSRLMYKQMTDMLPAREAILELHSTLSHVPSVS